MKKLSQQLYNLIVTIPKNNKRKNYGLTHIVIPCVIIICLIIISSIIIFMPQKIAINEIKQKNLPSEIVDSTTTNNDSATPKDKKNTNDSTNSSTSDSSSKLDDLTSDELRTIYEKQIKEEKEKLQKLIAEEEQFIPLVDKPDKLIQLHRQERIWLEKDVGAVIITGRVVLREGMLELFACKTNSKEHESIISIRVTPEFIHAALLAVGAESGNPVKMKPEFIPPSGDEIEIRVKWQDKNNGKIKESLAQEWIWDNANSKENNKISMKTHWVFTGSLRYKDDENNDHYVANETGELFGLSNFVGSILDIPIQSSADNDKLMFSCFTEKIPPLNTLVTIILTPIKNKK
ncbi:MAG: YdjY domain-containing protein [Planctomycetaceae bacterium]|jgi:hypothetical protein|nr:YdjY domain-containing protein [Planctomycetaceae bacterium]